MAETIQCSGTGSIELAEYIDYVSKTVDPRDEDSILASAPMLHALSLNKDFVADHMRDALLKTTNARLAQYLSPQSYVLGTSPDGHFAVRHNIWTVPGSTDKGSRSLEEALFAYNLAHDHDFDFLTVGYSGPGYETDIYEYNPQGVKGFIGERVELKFLERANLSPGKVMYYRASRDAHIQHPPESLSISLNLLISLPENRRRNQLYFNLERQTISGFPGVNIASKQISLINLLTELGGDRVLDGLEVFLGDKYSPRVRVAAMHAICRLLPVEASSWISRYERDGSIAVRDAARALLAGLSRDGHGLPSIDRLVSAIQE